MLSYLLQSYKIDIYQMNDSLKFIACHTVGHYPHLVFSPTLT